MKAETKPIFHAVLKYRYPVMAIASVLHRISGVILFLVIPFLLWGLDQSLASADSFQALQSALTKPIPLLFIWLILAALFYHLVAGTRHMIMDMGFGESLKGGRIGAYLVIALTVILLIVAGIWL